MDEQNASLALSVCNGIGPVRFQKLYDYFGSAQTAWEASLDELKRSGIGNKMSEDLQDFRKKFSLDRYLERMHKEGVWFVTLHQKDYPRLLGQIHNPPIIFYGKGNSDCLEDAPIKLAVVGTRKITDYGKQVTELLVSELAVSGCIIVSGLAMGVDAVAHQATLDAHGKTIAVLGSGVDLCTPQENTKLYERILANDGLILSETPLGQQPNKGSFPARNRIIAGLSHGVLVTEGAEDSGSLITANDAFKNKRNVFAVPGPITSAVSKGPILLIHKGAKMVTTAKEIMNELGIMNKGIPLKKKTITADTKEEQQIIDVLQNENLSFDDIVRQTGLASATVGTLLSLMELKGYVRSVGASFFSLTI
ncbi:MAG: DNA-processing protein DprA [Candidatus Levyibacteriota bacterium]